MNKKKSALFGDFFVLEDPEVILERRKAKDARLLSQLTEQERERYLYHLQFQEVLDKKAKEHRELFQRMKAKEEKRRKQKEHEALKGHHVTKRLERIQIQHDQQFIKSVTKSKYYEIIKEEQRLQSLGKLKSQGERDLFWSQRLGHSTIPFEENRSFAFPKMNWDDVLESKGSEWGDTVPSALPDQPMDSLIADSEDEKHHFHAMQKIAEETNEGESAVLTNRKSILTQRGRLTIKQLEQLYPRVTMPSLHCFQMDLSEKKIDDEQLQEIQARDKKYRKREMDKNVKRTMFELALSNAAITRRILDTHLNDDEEKDQLGLDLDYNAMNDITSLGWNEKERRHVSANSLSKTGKRLQSLTWVKINDANPILRDQLKQRREKSVDLLTNPRFKIHALKANERDFTAAEVVSAGPDEDNKPEMDEKRHDMKFGMDTLKNGKVALTHEDVESDAVIKYCNKPSTMWRNPFWDLQNDEPISEVLDTIE